MIRSSRWSILAAGILLTSAAACTTRSNAPTSVAENSAAGATVAAPPPATANSSPPSQGGAVAAATTLRLSTDPNTGGGINYSTDTLTAPPNTKVTLNYSNNSAVLHDWHLFDGVDAKAPSIAQTPIMAGPNDNESVQFTTPAQSGSYYFQCDVHPTQMLGHLVVK